MTIDTEQLDTLMIVNLISTGLSYIGELSLFFLYIRYPTLRSFSFKLVISLTMGDFLYSICNTLSLFRTHDISCEIEGFFRSYSLLVSISWVLAILSITYKQVTDPDPNINRHYR